jgi:hypothetical protein
MSRISAGWKIDHEFVENFINIQTTATVTPLQRVTQESALLVRVLISFECRFYANHRDNFSLDLILMWRLRRRCAIHRSGFRGDPRLMLCFNPDLGLTFSVLTINQMVIALFELPRI